MLTRGVDKIYPSREELQKSLESGKKLKLYQGFDPTGTALHIGHMCGLRKLRQWQEAGHEVIFLIGDGTGQAGDPSGKLSAREKFFTQEELRKNAEDYVKQASKIVRFDGPNPVKILFNGDWLNKLGLVDILNIAQNFSLQQLSERDMFQERIKKGDTVNLREFLYPLLQAYDSVAMEVDLELGGSDQTFNMLAGRQLVKAMQNREKFVMTTPLLTDSKGVKIGKSEGNVIGITDTPADLYAKIMTLPDDVIIKSFEYLTDTPLSEITKYSEDIKSGANPIDYKKKLAYELVRQLNTEEDAKSAQENFEKVVQNKETPTEVSEMKVTSGSNIVDLLVELGFAPSKSEARRLVEQNAVEVNSQRVTDPAFVPENNALIKSGKRNITKVVYE